MKIFFSSAGTVEDYTWQPELPSPPTSSWHRLLCEQDKAFALVAGRTGSLWHIEFRNLLLPEVRDDIAGRQIVFNIIFSGLTSEKEVRALALAYLDFEVKTKSNGRPVARYQPDLANAYSPTPDGSYQFNEQAIKAWAKAAIEQYSMGMEAQAAKGEARCSVSSADSSGIATLKQYLKTTALKGENELSLVWSDMTIGQLPLVDIKVKYNKEVSDTWTVVSAPVVFEPAPTKGGPKDPFGSPLPPTSQRLQKMLIIAVGVVVCVSLVIMAFNTSETKEDYKLFVKEAPRGCKIVLDGKHVGTTPCEVLMPDDDEDHQFVLELPDAPLGTRVILDGKEIGKTNPQFKCWISVKARELKLLPFK